METNNLTIKTTCDELFESVAHFSGAETIEDEYKKMLYFNNGLGKIDLKNVIIGNSLSTLHCKFKFSQDTNFEIHFNKKRSLLCLYSLMGEIDHSFSEIGLSSQRLHEFSPEMVFIHQNETIQFMFKKDMAYSFLIICIQDIGYLKERYKQGNYSLRQYREFFNFLKKESNNFYLGSVNLKLANQVRNLEEMSVEDISSHLFFEGIVYIILSLMIKQFTSDNDISVENQCSLTKQECLEIKRISDYIQLNPEELFTVELLCAQSGMSPCKLQEGFKLMHGRTVSDFIRNIRLEKAEELISHSNLNISEIVYSIGFTSRSYFAKIFKKKYNCSPKTYQNTKRMVAVTA